MSKTDIIEREIGGEQMDLLEDEVDEVLGEADPERFKFSLALKLEAMNGAGTVNMTIGSGRAAKNRIEEYLLRIVASERFRRLLRGIIGEPLPFSERTILSGSSISQESGEEEQRARANGTRIYR